jgi:hypothetical protein
MTQGSGLTSSAALKDADSSYGGTVLSVRGSRGPVTRSPPRHALPRSTAKAAYALAWLPPTYSIYRMKGRAYAFQRRRLGPQLRGEPGA